MVGVITRKYGRVVFGGWLFVVAAAASTTTMLVLWPPETLLSTILSACTLCLVLYVTNRKRTATIKHEHAFRLGLLRYASTVLDVMYAFYHQAEAGRVDKTNTNNALRQAEDDLRVCYASLPVTHVMRNNISLVGRARMAVEYYEPDNVPGRIYCAEHHLLEPFREVLSTRFFVVDGSEPVRRDLAAVEGMMDRLAGRVAAWKLVAPHP